MNKTEIVKETILDPFLAGIKALLLFGLLFLILGFMGWLVELGKPWSYYLLAIGFLLFMIWLLGAFILFMKVTDETADE
jgi:hypothetical protein